MTLFSVAQPIALDFDWNDSYVVDLGGAHVTFANGWYRTTVIVPSDEVNSSITSRSVNSFEFALDTSAGRIDDGFSLTIDP